MTTPPIPPKPVYPAIPQPGFEPAIVPPQPVGQSTAPSQIYAQPIAKKSSKTVVKVVLAVAGIFLLLVAAVIAYVGYQTSKIIDRGAVSSGELSSGELGVAEYPGSVRSTRKGATIKMIIPGGTSVLAAQYTTSASPAQVIDFYKSKLGRAADVTTLGDRTSLTLARDNDQKTILVRADDNGGSHITITRRYSTP